MTMASKTEMFKLLRLLDFGAGGRVAEEAAVCWEALPGETRAAMVANGGADGRRARVWAAGYVAGMAACADNTATRKATGER